TKEKEAEPKAGKPSSPKEPAPAQKPAEDPTHRNGTPPAPLPMDAGGEFSLEDDIQLQKAVELLKSWKIFKSLAPA
ncbi:MAG TPA: peptidase S41, partial [Nitrospiraceae bacterium]|nr:peptidase S41 [Nitrospiraceae bacterium]